MHVEITRSGKLLVECTADEVARLAGRTEFGSVEDEQERLRDAVAQAWYAADCPPLARARGGLLDGVASDMAIHRALREVFGKIMRPRESE